MLAVDNNHLVNNMLNKMIMKNKISHEEKLEKMYNANLGYIIPQPVISQKIYVNTSLYVYRGEDDFSGGIATISKIEHSETLPSDHYNYTMVGIKERPGTMYNWSYLYEQQEELKKEFGDRLAHPDPDNDPEFNDYNADWHR